MKDEVKDNSGLIRSAMRRLSEAREAAAQNQVNSQATNTPVKSRDLIQSGLDPTERVYVRAGEDYDPSPNSVNSNTSTSFRTIEPTQQDITRCDECGYPMNSNESYCPKCGSFSG